MDIQNNYFVCTYLKAVPRPGERPRPNGDEKKSSSSPPIEPKRLLWWWKISSLSKNELNGLDEPKNASNVALGSPWNSYVNEDELLFDVPFDLSTRKENEIYHRGLIKI